MLQVGYEVAGHLLNRLWIPKKQLRERINQFLDTEFNGYYVIGIQLRYLYLDDENDTRKFLDCAESLEKNALASIGRSNFTKKYKGFKWLVGLLILL